MQLGTIRRFLDDQAGATAIEYALLGLLVAVAIIGTVSVLGGRVETLFNDTATAVLATQDTNAD